MPRYHAFQQQQRHQPLAGRPAHRVARIAAAYAQEVQEQLEMQGADSAAALGNFLGWLVANGASDLHAWAANFCFQHACNTALVHWMGMLGRHGSCCLKWVG